MASVFKSPHGQQIVLERYKEILEHWPVAHRQHRIATRHGETFVVESGPENAPALILLHGTAANAASWTVDIPIWSQHFRVFCVDIIGDAGLSAQIRPPYDSDAHMEWFDDVLNGLSLATAALVGMSLGGWVALDYATRRPERVSKLVLLSPGGVGKAKNILLWAIPLLLLGPWGRRKMLERIGGRMDEPLPPSAAAIVDLSNKIFTHFIPRRSSLPQFSDEALQRLKMPVMAILGGKDVFIDARDTRHRLDQNVPDLTMRYLPDARHFIPGQTETVLQFLQGASDTGAAAQ
ncbi:alpha/beta fold hydrolase [Undibacter mobilis]|uniref:Alpha/beta hydrolase n=1 Tax=Undibacter mobilis TaxID=2292256 RepID=A0A371BD77_9BRAD|nr:alpha/beta hydrolase [Undibacter mobilis]RDV05566.1 alpha/beta hydrolase [Undibacter mobilis]